MVFTARHTLESFMRDSCVWSLVRLCTSVSFSTAQTCHRDRGGEFDISKLNSAQTWQWRSAVHSRRDCLYLHSCLWVLQHACPLHRPQPRPLPAHLLMTVLENQIHTRCMFYQRLLAGKRVCICVFPSLWLCVFFFLSLHLFYFFFLLQNEAFLTLRPAFNNRIRCWKLISLHRHKLLRVRQ